MNPTLADYYNLQEQNRHLVFQLREARNDLRDARREIELLNYLYSPNFNLDAPSTHDIKDATLTSKQHTKNSLEKD